MTLLAFAFNRCTLGEVKLKFRFDKSLKRKLVLSNRFYQTKRNIPHEAGIAACGRAFIRFPDERRPDLTVLSVLRLFLNSNDFMFHHECFQQTHGTMMEGAFGGSYASIFLGEWEERALSLEKHPVLWLRFIDDIPEK